MIKISFLFIILGLILLSSMIYSDGYTISNPQHNQSKTTLTISYANDMSMGYTIMTDNNQKYTISQRCLWTNNGNSRFSLEGYSIDNGPFVDIQRKTEGNFTLDIVADRNHSIVFVVKSQFEIIVPKEEKVEFSPPSPTNDNWFDANTNVKIIAPNVLLLNQENTRKQLSGWSLDNPDSNIISRQEDGSFISPVISMTSMHKIDLDYKTQYYLSVISNFGRALGTGWYDSGTIVNVSVVPSDDLLQRHIFVGWQGSVIGNGNQESVNVMVNSPKVLVAFWDIDYTNIIIIVIIIIASLVLLSIFKKKRANLGARVKK